MERTLHGVSAAPGVAIGPAVVLDWVGPAALAAIAKPARGAEVQKARAALLAAAADLEDVAARLRKGGRGDEAEIVEAGILIAADPSLLALVESLVLGSGLPAAVALGTAAEQSALELAALADPTLALRADDVRSVGRRASAHARGVETAKAGGVIVASTLGPADVADLSASGIALAGGGVTAHAAIVARSLGVPMVVGLGPEALAIAAGEEVVVDGDHGIVVRRPVAQRIALARAAADRQRLARETAVARRLEPAETKDGHRIRVLANASTVAELLEATEQGAEGVGLLRTELLFLDAAAWPSRDQQIAFLKPILSRLSGATATVRLFDFGGDKTPPFLSGTPARGIDLLLRSPEVLAKQLDAIVQAGGRSHLRILIPMVTGADQLRAVRNALNAVLGGRRAPKLGAMIETPEAALGAAAIAREADFLSIGTNDLTQLVLGLDREQSTSAPVTSNKVMRLIAATMRAARQAGIPVDVCGEAASDAGAMPILIGLGADELSVAAARVGEVRQGVRELSFAECRKAAEELLDQAGHARRKRV